MNALILLVILTQSSRTEEYAQIRKDAAVLNWEQLEKLNYQTGVTLQPLKTLLTKPIKIRGYAMPLEASGDGIVSIFLVSDLMYCSHVAPPPPNQMIYIKFDEPMPWRVFEQSLWLTGKLDIIEEKSVYGAFGYAMSKVYGLEKGGW